jgi:hypothetical protein
LKNRIYTYLLLITFGFISFLQAQVACISGSNTTYSFVHNGHAYALVKELKTWAKAAQCASLTGGYLTEITTQAEQVAVYNAIVAGGVSSNYKPITDGGGASYVWIGGSDSITEGNWWWDGDNNGASSIPQFWMGQGAAGLNNGVALNGAFNNWGGKSTTVIKEPDNFGVGQDALAMALGTWPYGVAGEWNDVSSLNTMYYVIEYNGITIGLTSNQIEDSDISIYPNPSNEKIMLEANSNLKKIIITTVDGKVVREIFSSQKSLTLDVSELSKGIYFVRMTLPSGEVVTKKMVKN